MNRSPFFSTLGRISLLVLTLCLIATILIFSRPGHQTKVLAQTTLGFKQAGDSVNLETDVVGKYVVKYLRNYSFPGTATP